MGAGWGSLELVSNWRKLLSAGEGYGDDEVEGQEGEYEDTGNDEGGEGLAE